MFRYASVARPLFPTTAGVAWLPEFLRPRFGTICETESGFGTPGAPDPGLSPECPASSPQLQRGGLPCPDYPLFSCLRFLILKDHRQKITLPPDHVYQIFLPPSGKKRFHRKGREGRKGNIREKIRSGGNVEFAARGVSLFACRLFPGFFNLRLAVAQ